MSRASGALTLVLAAALCAAPVAAQQPTGTAGATGAAAAPANIQQQLQQSQRRLEEIRAERAQLQEELQSAQGHAKDISSDLTNVERRLSGSRSALSEIQFQSDAVADRIQDNNRDLILTREHLRETTATLDRRLRDIYEMGALHTVRVLLGADSFTDLLNRYRYLRLITTYDRALVQRANTLEQELVQRDEELHANLSEIGRLRQTRIGEVAELRSMEDERKRTLDQFRSREKQAQTRLQTLDADESRMKKVLDDLERRRVDLEKRAAATSAARPAAPTMAASDVGKLDWPVEGSIVYKFGREVRPNGTVLRWNGVGIGAKPGTPVRAVKSGTVVLAGAFEGYGPTVVISHGQGFYTLYLYLEDIGVTEGHTVQAGQVVGTVGGGATPEGPHLEFQVRAPATGGGSPQAQDPLNWLRKLTPAPPVR